MMMYEYDQYVILIIQDRCIEWDGGDNIDKIKNIGGYKTCGNKSMLQLTRLYRLIELIIYST